MPPVKPDLSITPTRERVETEKRRALTKWEFARLFLDQLGKCKICGVKLEKGNCHDDHIIPLACGGTNAIDNRQLLCAACHNVKTDRVDKSDAARIKRRQNAAETGKGRKGSGKKLQGRGFRGSRKFNGEVKWKDKT